LTLRYGLYHSPKIGVNPDPLRSFAPLISPECGLEEIILMYNTAD
jgi:hypothetical protein